jgi:cbb3-type cytochrome c oxidase subunit III
MNSGWSWYVIALVALNIAGCAWLLWWTAKRRPGDPKPEDTSHVWDEDITEYNKPLPKWWINLFWITIVFGIGYLIWYPGLGNLRGYAGWTSQVEHARQKAAYDAKLDETFAPYRNRPIDALAADPAALKLGRSIFSNTCATCHGSSAQGATGYPNLTDDIWHWGGSPDRVLETVLDGLDRGELGHLGHVEVRQSDREVDRVLHLRREVEHLADARCVHGVSALRDVIGRGAHGDHRTKNDKRKTTNARGVRPTAVFRFSTFASR